MRRFILNSAALIESARVGADSLRTNATVIACGLLLGASACAGVQTAAVVEPGASFTLAPGESAAVKGTDARITFKRVTDDSRCPVDVTCVWAGDAKVEVAISRNGAPDETRILSITPPKHEAIVGNLRIRFVSLAPVPRQADASVPRKYLAGFVVDRM